MGKFNNEIPNKSKSILTSIVDPTKHNLILKNNLNDQFKDQLKLGINKRSTDILKTSVTTQELEANKFKLAEQIRKEAENNEIPKVTSGFNSDIFDYVTNLKQKQSTVKLPTYKSAFIQPLQQFNIQAMINKLDTVNRNSIRSTQTSDATGNRVMGLAQNSATIDKKIDINTKVQESNMNEINRVAQQVAQDQLLKQDFENKNLEQRNIANASNTLRNNQLMVEGAGILKDQIIFGGQNDQDREVQSNMFKQAEAAGKLKKEQEYNDKYLKPVLDKKKKLDFEYKTYVGIVQNGTGTTEEKLALIKAKKEAIALREVELDKEYTNLQSIYLKQNPPIAQLKRSWTNQRQSPFMFGKNINVAPGSYKKGGVIRDFPEITKLKLELNSKIIDLKKESLADTRNDRTTKQLNMLIDKKQNIIFRNIDALERLFYKMIKR